jgi:hypothetical protein
MIRLTGATLLLLHALLFVTYPAQAASAHQRIPANNDLSQTVEWTSREAQHVYGLPEVKPKEKGALSIYASGLSFTGKTGSAVIPIRSVIAVSAGNQWVERAAPENGHRKRRWIGGRGVHASSRRYADR